MNRGTTGTIVYGLVALLLAGLFYMLWKKEKQKVCCGCDQWTFLNQYDAYQMLLKSDEIKNSCIHQPNLAPTIAACLVEKLSKTAGDYTKWKKNLGPTNDTRKGYTLDDMYECSQAICK